MRLPIWCDITRTIDNVVLLLSWNVLRIVYLLLHLVIYSKSWECWWKMSVYIALIWLTLIYNFCWRHEYVGQLFYGIHFLWYIECYSLSLVHENGGYWYVLADKGVFWRASAGFDGQWRIWAESHCPPKPVSLGTQVNPWRAMACNPPFPAIARPYPPVWELRLKLRNEFGGLWRDPA